MKCPYAVTRITQTFYENHYNNDGYNDHSEVVETNNAIFVECKKEDCGAWQDGKCNYKG